MTDDAAAYRRIPLELVNEKRLDLVDELFAEDYVEHIPVPPGVPPTRDGVRMCFTALLAAFPDFHYEILDQHQDGDIHIGRIRASGTMAGDFMGMPASGKSAAWDEIHIGRMADGKVTEHWGVVDQYGMLVQLGFVPAPPGS